MKHSIHIQQHPLQLQNSERQTTGNQKQGEEVVRQWMSLPTGQLVNRLLTSFPSSEQTIRHMNEAQIRQIVEEVYAEINTNITPTAQTIPSKQPSTIHCNKPNPTSNEQQQGMLVMKSKLIDLIPEIKGEIQEMQHSDLVPFYKVVMEQYSKAINHSTTTPQTINVDQSNEELKQSEQAQQTQQKPQPSQAISIKDFPKQTQQVPLLPLASEPTPQQVPNKQIELNCVNLQANLITQTQNNLKRTHQQMKESNPLTIQFNPQQLRSKLMAKLPHLSKYLSSLTPSDLQTIYHQSLLAQTQSIQKGHQKNILSFHKSDKTETRLIQLQEAQNNSKTVVLLHSQFDPSTKIDQGLKIKQTNEGIERKTSNDTFNKIFKVLSEQ